MPKVPCDYAKCGGRRRSRDDPDTPRGHQQVEVPEGHEGRAYCSAECTCYAGASSVGVCDSQETDVTLEVVTVAYDEGVEEATA